MRVMRKYNQSRRDCACDLECEGCGNKKTNHGAYDDRNYWDNVVPNQNCDKCGKSSKDLGVKVEHVSTRYPEGEQH